MKEGDKTFTLYWRTGDREIVHGRDVAEAMTRAGYGGGSVRELDFYANGDNDNYVWNPAERKWNNTKFSKSATA
jgi:hypothetical protein